ncbi:MAG: N-acetylmuramoyl-L-alanine amidase [Gemmatimonadales bacterium]
MKFISRKEWGAKLPKSVTSLNWAAIDLIYVHYTSMLSDQTGNPRVKMRGIQDFHMRVKGWTDVAYNWAFAFSGEILEGRGWKVRSAATGAENSHSVAFVFLGGDKAGRDDVTPKGRTALGTLIREALRLKREANGQNAWLKVRGHTQAPGSAGQTDCPGLEILSYIAMRGWEVVEPAIKYPRNFFLFASWYLAEGNFKGQKPHDQSIRPKNLPGRYTPGTAALMVALRHYLRRRNQ